MNKFLLRRLGVADDPAGFKPTLHNSLEAALAQSEPLAEDILEGLKGLLTPAKVKSHALNPVAGARQVVEDLCERGDEFKKLFAESLRAAVYGGDTQRMADKPLVRFDDFQFLEEEQIDANIEYALTQQEVQMAVEDVLPALNGMISSLMGWTSIQPHLNPLKPDSFVHALRTSLTAMVRREEDRAAVMTPAAGLMGTGLRQLYREITDWLRSQGIEPILPHAKAGGGFGGAGKAPETSVTRTMLTLDKLRRLLSGELSFDLQPPANKDFTHTVPASFLALEDLKLVEPMMKRLKERARLAAPESSSASKASGKRIGDKPVQREKTHSRKLGRELGEEVVRLMLENLMQDGRLMAPVRSSLKTLEPVLIKMSQLDARFFSERQHPARQFLDRITSRSLAFTSVDEPGYGRFQKALDNSISVLVMGESDAAGFSRVLRKLEDGWSKDEQEQRTRAEEAARELLHVEQRNLLAQRLAHEFTEKLQGKKLPEIVLTFLRGPWAQVVAESQLLPTDGSADPEGYKNLVEDLVWSVQPRLARRNRARLVDLVPSMLVTMRQGLGLISYPSERITVFFDELIAIHEQAFEGVRNTGPAPLTDSAGAVLNDGDSSTDVSREEFWMAEHEASDSGFLEAHAPNVEEFPQPPEMPEVAEPQNWSTDSLTPGCWVDLALGGVWVRAQLTWASPHRTLFMFISGAGLAHSMSRRTMNRLHGLGLIRFVSDGRVMDNALDAVAQAALRNDLGKGH